MTSMVVVSKENTAGANDTLLPDTKDDEEQKTDSDQRESNFYHNFGISRFSRRALVKSQQGIKLFGIVDVVISSRENTTSDFPMSWSSHLDICQEIRITSAEDLPRMGSKPSILQDSFV
jgi:hypothetical protein